MKRFKIYLFLLVSSFSLILNGQNRTLLGALGGGEGVNQIWNYGNSNPTPPQYDLIHWYQSHSNYGGFNVVNSNPRSGDYAYNAGGGSTAGSENGPLIPIIGGSTKKWVMQFYARIMNPTGGGVYMNFGYNRTPNVDGTAGNNVSYDMAGGPSGAYSYTKVVVTNSNITNANYVALFANATRSGGYNGTNLDDIAIYETDDGLEDNTAPEKPTNASILNNPICPGSAIDLNWLAPSTGTDGGGYLVIRYTTNPATNDIPNVNGIYVKGNTITNSNTGIVVYQGIGSSFTDSTCSSNTTYYYNILTYDKAYNYSSVTTVSTTTANIGPSTITNVSPNFGAIGSSIVLTGTNFNFVNRFNDVWFGPVKGTVTAASGTQLTVTVPSQSTNELISHMNYASKKIGTSPIPFRTSFSGLLSTTSMWSGNTSLNAGNQISRRLAFGDLNNDGKAEEVVSMHLNSNYAIRIFNNTSSVGSDISFSSIIGLGCASAPMDVKLSDLNGDGKLDIVFVSSSTNNTLSIYKNNYVSGTFSSASFDSRLDVATGTTGGYNDKLYIAIGDIDGDGLPDIVTNAMVSNKISIFLNTSSNGSISFATQYDISIGNTVTGIAIGDLDKDGLNDIIVASQSANSLSIFRNNSTIGNVNLGNALSINTDNGTEEVKVFDIDLDGYLDIATTCNSGSKLDIFKNLLASTSVSASNFTSSNFGSKISLITGTSPKGFDFADLNGDGLLDIGVVNNGSGTVSLFKNTTSSGTISFTTKFDYSITNGSLWSMSFVDLNYDNLPDMAFTANNDWNVYYKKNYPYPNISSITNNVCPNTTVTITGNNIDNALDVSVGGTSVSFTIISPTSITFTATTSTTGLIKVTTPLGSNTYGTGLTLGTSAPSPTATGTTICYNSTAILTASVANGYTLNWYQNATGGTSLGSGGTFTTDKLTNTTTYYVESSSTCSSASRTAATATVVQSVGGTASANQVICSGTSPTALSLSGNMGTIQWYASTDNINFSSISSATNSSYTPGALTATTYYKAGSSNSPCGIAYSSVVTIQVGFTATLTKVDPNCETPGSMTASSVVSPGGDTNLFYSLDNTTWQSSNVFNNKMNNNYSIYIKSNSCTTSSNVGSITLSGPTASTIVLTANTPATYSSNVYNGYDAVGITASGGSSYVWSGGASTNSASNSFKYSGSYSLTMTNASGCTSVSSIQVSVKVKGLDMYGNSTEDSTIQLTPYGDINRSYAVDQYGIIHDTKTGKDGSSSLKAAISGLQLAHDYPSYSSGWYWIKSANMPNALQMYVDMTEDGGGYDFYFVTGGPSVTNVVSDKNGGTDLGLDLVMPRSKYHWRAMSNAVIAGIAIGSTKVGSGTYESFFQTAYGIYRSSNTGNAGSNSYTNYVMRSSYYGGTNNAADWKVKDGGRWWLRDTVHGEPNGDYTLNTVLGLLLWNSASFPNPYALGDLNFNDQTTGYSTGNFYLVSTNVKQ